jgi:hypothetical protein
MSRNITARGILLTSVAAALLAASAASAQPSRQDRSLREPGYRELRNLAQQLDDRAHHAADLAAHDRYRLYRRDNTFLRQVSDFARRASRFDSRLARYRAEPWPVQDEVRDLLRSARDIQGRVRQSRWVDEHTMSDWNEIVEILSRMDQISDGRIDLGGRPGPSDFGPPQRMDERDPNRNPPPPPPDRRLDESGARGPAGPGGSRGNQLADLARELEDRAGRALETAQRVATERGPYRREYMQVIRDFNSQAAAFRQNIGAGTMSPGQIRAEASRLLDITRQNDQRMRQENAFREVWPDWQGAMQTLQRIIDQLR